MADIGSDVEYDSPVPKILEPDTDSETYSQSRRRRGDDVNNENVSPLNLSPPISPLDSPSLSPYSLSPLSPLRLRPFSPPIDRTSSPYSQSDEVHDGHGDNTQNTKKALIQRLNGLAERLSRQHHAEDENIHVLHAKVDELEGILSTPGHSFTTKTRPRGLSNISSEDEQDGAISWKEPQPDSLLPSDVSAFSSPTGKPSQDKSLAGGQDRGSAERASARMTVAQAEQVIEEAQLLHKDLETVIANLRDRQEETEHIHALLITRLERAAQRIIDLEEQINHLERERRDGETEMLNLQIQLKAIEVQCLSYVPVDADRELRESIDTWKMEYSALKQKRARNRASLNNGTPVMMHGTPATPRTPSTPLRIRRATPSKE